MAPVEQWSKMARAPPPGCRTLWVGDLEEWMNEEWMWHTFGYGATVTEVKVVRDKFSGKTSGFGFVEFPTTFDAEQVLIGYQGKPIANHPQAKKYKLNWAAQGLSGKTGTGAKGLSGGVANSTSADYPIFVGDLAPEVTDHMLLHAFQPGYPSTTSAKVVIDKTTGVSKSFGFVRFADNGEQQRAIVEMNGVWLGTRQIRCGEAQNNVSSSGLRVGGTGAAAMEPKPVGAEDDYSEERQKEQRELPAHITSANFTKDEDKEGLLDPSNTTLFVGGLDPNVTDVVLCTTFAVFGTIIYCRVPPGKACGFIQFDSRDGAECALQTMNNTHLLGGKIRVSWGKAGVGRGNKPIAAGFQKLFTAPEPSNRVAPSLTNQMTTDSSQYGYGQQPAYGAQPAAYAPYPNAYGGFDGSAQWWGVQPQPQAPAPERDIFDEPVADMEVENNNYISERLSKFEDKALSRSTHGCSWSLWNLQQTEGDDDILSEWDRSGINIP
mmetsp:Transcript_2866/g.4076  ORF Transcript_2866/g.4076 Transcript_2866/m.4076 type:complete len:492 (-) Transcript_2866:354-1829(-)